MGYTTAGSGIGWFHVGSFPGLENLPEDMQEAVVRASNNSVSKKTWQTYGSVRKHLEQCEQKVGSRFRLPMDQQQVVVFVAFLLSTGKLKAGSVDNILSALRMYHLANGFYSSALRPDCVKHILRGRRNQDALEEREKITHLPVTLNVLELIRLSLKHEARMGEEEKSVVWAVSTIAFSGCIRVGELLSKKARSIDPSFDLQKKDVKQAGAYILTHEGSVAPGWFFSFWHLLRLKFIKLVVYPLVFRVLNPKQREIGLNFRFSQI